MTTNNDIISKDRSEVFQEFVLYLLNNGIDFSIENHNGDFKSAILSCPTLDLMLSLQFDFIVKRNRLMLAIGESYSTVSSLADILDKIRNEIDNKNKEENDNNCNKRLK